MFNKKIIIISMLIVIFSISCVSASHDSSDTIMHANDLNEETISLDETIILEESVGNDQNMPTDSSELYKTDEILSQNQDSDNGNFTDLASELDKYSQGDNVSLEKNYIYDNETDARFKVGISITKSLTINGQNHIIDGSRQARIFNVTGNNVVLKNIEFINGYSPYGSAVYFSGENLTIENCTFKNNFAYDGGAVYADNSAVFIDSSFINNFAYHEGGAIHVGNVTNITKCIFDGNIAELGASLFIRKQYVLPPEDDSGSGNESEDSGADDSGSPDDGDDSSPDDEEEYDIDGFPEDDTNDFDDRDDWVPDTFIKDSIFRNSRDFYRGGIFIEALINNVGYIDVKNTIFENMSAEYGPAVFTNEWVWMNFTDCSFRNLHANKTGGAVVFLSNPTVKFINCNFTNTTSKNNGGAIFYDANSWNPSSIVSLKIFNSRFFNCSSGFGGAIAHIGTTLRIVNSTLADNFATYDGGAVYSSGAFDVYSYNSNFTNNKLNFTPDTGLSFGGAMFVSYAKLVSINNTIFTGNTNNAAYIYSSRLRLNNSFFENNDEAVRLVCKIDTDIGENNLTTDKWTDLEDDPFFTFIIEGEGIQLELINNTLNVDSLPSFFNSNEWGWVTPVKDQGFSGGCWCFSTISAIESSLLKSTGVFYDFSEQNMQKLMLTYSKYGHQMLMEGGFTGSAILYALSWLGPIDDEKDTFDMIGKFTRVIPGKNIHVQDVILIPNREVSYDLEFIKKTILKCGAITADFYAFDMDPYFNANTSAYYYNETDYENEEGQIIGVQPTHAISIVGWDDNYPASNFLITPPGNGAWIVKNSYGEGSYDNGYCYISYYDTVIYKQNTGLAVLFENTENYTKNYQTGFGGEVEILNETQNYSYKNNYQSIDDDYISAIGTYFLKAGEEYSFEIIVNDELKLTQDGTAPFYGYHTIKLDTQIPVKKGDNFTVVMKTHSIPLLIYSKIKFKENISFIDEGKGWEDLSLDNCTAILRVYTMDNLRPASESRTGSVIEAANITVSAAPSGTGSLQITLKTTDGKPMAYKQLEVIFNSQSMNLITDVNGTAELVFGLDKSGKYPVNIIYLGDENHMGTFALASITVNPVKTSLTASGITYLATLKNKEFKAKLSDANGNPIAFKTVTFIVAGITIKAITDANGVATVKLALTSAKTYDLTINFDGDSVYASHSLTVKVKLTKEKTKVNAPKKTFKKNKKVKKVVITLKNSKGKAIAKKKLTLTINKKKYTAKTNAKGKATFKIKNLNKKGTKKYTVKFAGDTQYNSCKKTGKIKVK